MRDDCFPLYFRCGKNSTGGWGHANAGGVFGPAIKRFGDEESREIARQTFE